MESKFVQIQTVSSRMGFATIFAFDLLSNSKEGIQVPLLNICLSEVEKVKN